MVLMVSGRCDIVAFYTKWFMNRYYEGFVDTRNPFNPKLVSRIYFKDVDLILFCTKNPIPILPYLKDIKKPILFHVTLTPYKRDIEPNVPDKQKIIQAIKEISKIIGTQNVYVRYDPIIINDKYTVEYHIKAFDKMCKMLKGYVKHIIISFVDIYKNVRENMEYLKIKELTDEDYKLIGENFYKSASENDMTVQTCFEDKNLVEYGFIKEDCLGATLAYKLTGKVFDIQTARKEKKCACVKMVDIGAYNTCHHLCKYCYANYNEQDIDKNIRKHNPNSSLLIGDTLFGDVIKERYR